jgi:ABC-type glutathione transport system ATPase component
VTRITQAQTGHGSYFPGIYIFGRGRQLLYGQVYSTLGRLSRDGKVTAGQTEPGDGPERRRYAITDTGRTEVDAWLADPVEPEPHLQTVLFAKVAHSAVSGEPLIRARDRWKSFGPTAALGGANVTVGRAEFLAVMGPSGSGKSTLPHCLAGIFPAVRGYQGLP